MNTITSARGRNEIRPFEPPPGVQWFNFDPESSALARPLKHSFASDSKATEWKPAAPTVAVVLDALSHHQEGAKNGLAFVFADLPRGARKKDNVRAVTAVGLDLDDGALSGDELDRRISKLGWVSVRYTTHSHTRAHPKHRVIFPVATPFDLLSAGDGDHRRGCEAWSRIPLAVGAALGVEIDRACLDPSRAFYAPRHRPGAPWEVSVFGGDLLDVKTLDLPPLDRPRGRPTPTTEGGRKLRAWAKERAGGFQIADAIQDFAEDRIRSRDGVKLTVECPFAAHHSNPGDAHDAGFFVANAGEGKGGGFTAFCAHNHCRDRDRLDFLNEMIARQWLPESILTDPDYYPLADDPAPVVENRAEPITLEEVKALTPESDEREVEVVAARIARLGSVPRARMTKALAKAAGIDVSTARKEVELASKVGREAPPEPSCDLRHLLDQIPLPSPAHGDFTFGNFDGQPWVFEACGDTGAARRLYTPWGVQSGAVYRDRDNRRGLRLTLLSCGSRLVEIDAPAALIADAKAFRAEMLARGVAFTPDGGERAASLVAQFQPSKPVSVFDRPGWREPGVFLTPWGEVIAADDAEPAALSRAGMPRGDAKAGTLEGWTEAVSAAFGLGLVQMQLGVIAGLTSPVLDLCGYESRSLFFGGAAGRGKSTSHELQCSVWGDPAIKSGLFGTFAVSANAPELLLQQGSGAGIAADEVKHLRSSLQQFLFMVWSGTGKSRMDYRAFGLKEAARWSCLFVTSYEDSLAAKIRADGETLLPGLGARVLEIAADATELTPEAVAPVLAVHNHYGHGGPAFIRAMFDQGYADDPDTLRKEVEAKADTLMKVRRSDQRRAAITAALMWQAGEIATEAGLIPGAFPLTAPEAARKGERESVSDDGEGREPDHGEAMPPATDLERLMYAAWVNAAGAESAATDVMSKAVDTLIRNLVTGLGVMVADGADGMTRGPRLAFQMAIQPVAGGVYRDVYVIPVPGVAALAEAPVDPAKIAKALDARGALLRYERAPGQDGRNRATERTWPHVPGLGKVRALIVPVSAVT